MSDSRGNNNGVNDAVLSDIVDLVLMEDAEFLLFAGDLVNGGDESTMTSQLYHWRDVMEPIYSSDMYGAKIFATPGNHDSLPSVWQSVFSDLPSDGPPGEAHMTYSFDYLNAHFVVLNTNRYGEFHTINYDWLADDLASTTADYIFVFGHEPAFPAGPHLGNSLDYYPDQRDAFWELLKYYNVDVYFAGHEHLYNHVEVDGIHQVIAGTAGAPIYNGFGGAFYHYALINIDGSEVSIKIIDDSGVERDSFDISQHDRKVSFGLISDVHYSAHHPERLTGLENAVQTWNSRDDLDFAVELGDFIHQGADAEEDAESQAVAETAILNFNGDVYGVIGNHELPNTPADDYVSASAIIPARYYSFDSNGIHFIVLFASNDPFYTVDSEQLTWLENDLASSSLPKIVFSHQRFDEDYPGVDPWTGGPYCMNSPTAIPHETCYSAFAYNSDEVRDVLEGDGDVLAVFSGHTHLNARKEINGIRYITLGTSYESHTIVNVSKKDHITVEGFGRNAVSLTITDTDGDGIFDGGEPLDYGSPVVGDNPCVNGNTVDCDDNCIYIPNSNQADTNANGVGDICEDFYAVLTTSVDPPEAGTVTPDCSEGCVYENGSIVTLTANKNSGYRFGSWLGCDSPLNNICTMTMNADKILTAQFDTCPYPPVKRVGREVGYFDSIQSAYNTALNGAAIYGQYLIIDEDLNFDRGIAVVIRGGYNCNYKAIVGTTVVEGDMTISDGTVRIQGGKLKIN